MRGADGADAKLLGRSPAGSIKTVIWRGEFGWSRAIDSDHYGADGGNSFSRLGEDPAQQPIDCNGRLYPPASTRPVDRVQGSHGRSRVRWWLGSGSSGRRKKTPRSTPMFARRHLDSMVGGASLDQGQAR